MGITAHLLSGLLRDPQKPVSTPAESFSDCRPCRTQPHGLVMGGRSPQAYVVEKILPCSCLCALETTAKTWYNDRQPGLRCFTF